MTSSRPKRERTIAAQLVLNTIRRPVIMIGADGHISYANADAEDFFRSSASTLAATRLDTLLPFGSPLLSLVKQVRESRAPVNEYRVDISSPRLGPDKLVDLYVAPVMEFPGSVVVMFKERSMAEKIDRQMTHRGAARSVPVLPPCLPMRSRTRCPAFAARRSSRNWPE